MNTIRLIFICHGNICRSPMAESVCAFLLKKRGIQNVSVASKATRTDEIGSSPHYGTQNKLRQEGVPLVPHRASLLTRADLEKYDFFLGMDEANVRDMRRILGSTQKPVTMLLSYSSRPRAIADPWYTGDFDKTYQDVVEGVNALLDYLEEQGLVEKTQ